MWIQSIIQDLPKSGGFWTLQITSITAAEPPSSSIFAEWAAERTVESSSWHRAVGESDATFSQPLDWRSWQKNNKYIYIYISLEDDPMDPENHWLVELEPLFPGRD